MLWDWDGTLERIHHALYVATREREGREHQWCKRHILVDTLGLLLNVVVHPADVQDRDGARLVLDRRTRCLFPFIEYIFADAGYQGPRVTHHQKIENLWPNRDRR